MTQLEIIFGIKDKVLHTQFLAVQNKDTLSESILYNKTVQGNKEWITVLLDLYEVCKQPKIRCILQETDIITATTTKNPAKIEMKLLKDIITMGGHQLIIDNVYYLFDTDYYIVSLISNKLISMANKVHKILKIDRENIEVVSQNKVILGLINLRAQEERDRSDYGIVIKSDTCWKVYIVAKEGVPFRILEAKAEEDVKIMLESGQISRAILISHDGNEFFGLKSIIKIHRGMLSDNQDTILYLSEPSENEVEIDITSEDLLLFKDSIDYEKISKWLLPRKVIISFTVLFVIIIGIVSAMSIFLLSDSGKEFVTNTARNLFHIELKLGNNRGEEIKKVVTDLMDRMGIKPDVVNSSDNEVTVRFLNSLQNTLIEDMIKVLEANNYEVTIEMEEDSGNVLLYITYNEPQET